MRVTEYAVRNPFLIASATIAICLFGLLAYFRLGVATLPKMNIPGVAVFAVYPGADPDTVEAQVTRPLEDAIAQLPHINRSAFVSTSQAGIATILVEFTDAANASLVAIDVQRAVISVRNRLPPEVEAPSVVKFDTEALGVATIVVSGSLPLIALQELAEDVVQPRLNAVPGVSSVVIRSGVKREIQVLARDDALRARGLSINHLIGAIQGSQIEIPAGSIRDGVRDIAVAFDALAARADALGGIVIAQMPNGPVRVADVARVDDTIERRSAIVRVDDTEGVSLVVAKLGDASSIAVVGGVRAALVEMAADLPLGVNLDVVIDASRYTAKSFSTVQKALLEAVIVTGFILLLFLHTWRSTVIVLISIPVSILSTLIVMRALDLTLDLLTMLALTVSVGILVDDSIVVLENTFRHLNLGKSPVQAALDGRGEIGRAALTITLVDVVVYFPMAIMTTGLPRQALAPFAIAITTATLASLAVSFILTPLMASRLLRGPESSASTSLLARFGRLWDRGFAGLERRYEALLRASLPSRGLVIAIGVLSFVGGMALPAAGLIGLDFFPSGDQSEVNLQIDMPPGTSLDATDEASRRIERELRAMPEVVRTFTVVGSGAGADSFSTSANRAEVIALLVPPRQRAASAREVLERIRTEVAPLHQAARFTLGMPNGFGFGGFDGPPIQIQVRGNDPEELRRLADRVAGAVSAIHYAAPIERSDTKIRDQLRAVVDWSRAADLGVLPRDAGVALRATLDGYTANGMTLRQSGRSAIPIRIRREGAATMATDDLRRLPVAGARGIVDLGQFVTLRTTTIPNAIIHVDRQRAITISTAPTGERFVGDLQQDVTAALATIPVPAGSSISFGGQGAGDERAFGELISALLVGVLLMYMLMLILFGSATIPMAVMMSLPLAVIGALGGLAVTGNPFTIFSMIGIVVLSGLVGKNAILLVDYTARLRREGYTRDAAILRAGPTRLRPIIMTTVSVMAALLPIAAGLEEGSELLVSVAVVLIGGLLTSTLLTLVFVPAMYSLFDDIEDWLMRRLGGAESVPVARGSVAAARE